MKKPCRFRRLGNCARAFSSCMLATSVSRVFCWAGDARREDDLGCGTRTGAVGLALVEASILA
jgi:hypothetical protein